MVKLTLETTEVSKRLFLESNEDSATIQARKLKIYRLIGSNQRLDFMIMKRRPLRSVGGPF